MSLQITVQQDSSTQHLTTTAVASGDDVDAMIRDLKRIFPSLVAGTALPPMQEQPARDPVPQPKNGEVIEPAKEPKSRKGKTKEPETIDAKAEVTAEVHPELTGLSDNEQLDVVRARLKKMGATDGLGHDKVFELLGKYGAKNASTIPADKRTAVLNEVDAAIAGAVA